MEKISSTWIYQVPGQETRQFGLGLALPLTSCVISNTALYLSNLLLCLWALLEGSCPSAVPPIPGAETLPLLFPCSFSPPSHGRELPYISIAHIHICTHICSLPTYYRAPATLPSKSKLSHLVKAVATASVPLTHSNFSLYWIFSITGKKIVSPNFVPLGSKTRQGCFYKLSPVTVLLLSLSPLSYPPPAPLQSRSLGKPKFLVLPDASAAHPALLHHTLT